MTIQYNANSVFSPLFKCRGSVMFRRNVFILAVWGFVCGFLVLVLNESGNFGSVTGRTVKHGDELLDSALHNVLGFVLTMLLAFRAQLSYQRFWSGLGNVQSIADHTLTGASEIAAYFAPSKARTVAQKALMEMMRVALLALDKEQGGNDRIRQELLYLQAMGLAALTKCEVEGGKRADSIIFAHKRFTGIYDLYTSCVMLQTTPMPLPFVQVLLAVVYFFVATIPLTFSEKHGYLTPITTFFIGFSFASIDAISSQMEDPFGEDSHDLDLDLFVDQTEVEFNIMLQASQDVDRAIMSPSRSAAWTPHAFPLVTSSSLDSSGADVALNQSAISLDFMQAVHAQAHQSRSIPNPPKSASSHLCSGEGTYSSWSGE